MKKELLAPAGDVEAGYAALYYGADAVYLGLKQFSARATAQNFDEEELNAFVGFAHSLNRKVFVALNTVVQQAELQDVMLNLDICKRCRVDAVIVQDLGVARLVQHYYPELALHASTQMAVHNKEGALALKNMGFSRVVLARELTLAEIKDIAKIQDLELEVFVHGALCYSYSGLCQFSSFESGRSANRGKCLYPCRALFSGQRGEEHCFSMKDLALEEDILRLPVFSLKIEGRKKNALYVAAVTDYYRTILDGHGTILEKAQNIKQIFSRPWCKFHFSGQNKNVIDTKFVGHRGLCIGKVETVLGKKIAFRTNHEVARYDGIQLEVGKEEKPFGFSLKKLCVDGRQVLAAKQGAFVEMFLPDNAPLVSAGEKVYLASSSKVKGGYGYQKAKAKDFLQRQKIDVRVVISKDKISAFSGLWQVEQVGSFEPALHAEKMKEALRDAFAKTGETPFTLGNFELENPDNLFVPLSCLNALRRSLYEKIVPQKEAAHRDFILPRPLAFKSEWIVKTDRAESLSLLDFDKIKEIILLLTPEMKAEDVLKLPKEKVRLALPEVCRHVKDFEPLIGELLRRDFRKWEIGNYWGFAVLPLKKIDLSFDAPLYMFNEEAVEKAKELGVSRITLPVEDTLANLEALCVQASLPTVAVVYQDPPLFRSAVCLRQNSCASCDHKSVEFSFEKQGQTYRALLQNCHTFVFSQVPFSVAEMCKNLKTNFYRADFCSRNYTPEEVKALFEKLSVFEDVKNALKGNLKRKGAVF